MTGTYRIPVAPAQGPANTNGAPPTVNVINNGEVVTAEVQQRPDGSLDVILDKIEGRSANRVSQAQSPLSSAIAGGRRLRG
ncbi:hypothetical protein FV226_22045 [Methylobacterium sp. WL12]|uniref:hypothetical protein n=1 Tax=Methylobacterium sp. WL12 TaxID=2603890 RepID=UPI0011CC1FF0|nr:hypothetical protein [Methylobacterium sp. WL12]TXM67408.1 hypothetical protein FV226_22045 [Methylobacterium sp. WL12]